MIWRALTAPFQKQSTKTLLVYFNHTPTKHCQTEVIDAGSVSSNLVLSGTITNATNEPCTEVYVSPAEQALKTRQSAHLLNKSDVITAQHFWSDKHFPCLKH